MQTYAYIKKFCFFRVLLRPAFRPGQGRDDCVMRVGADYSPDFNSVFPELAARYNVALVPSVLAGAVGNPTLNLSDGPHPNAAGQRLIAEGI
jgi:lysophospholipase L1-like esterase